MNDTFYHKILAKCLIRRYPKMVNDIYLSDEFYGQSCLHLAIINEDPSTVKMLLDNKADIHQRCLGKFFYPNDQKNKLKDSKTSEEPILPLKTNYFGYFYYGEYPLSFAAVLNQEESMRLLLAYGADPNKQDSNGNTVLHMVVIGNNMVYSMI